MRRSKPYMRSLFHRSLTRREHAAPKPIQAIEQKEPRRAHKGLRLGYANLGTMVVAEHLCRPLRRFRTGNPVEGLNRRSRDPQRHCAEARDDTGKRRDVRAGLREDIWVGEARPKAVRHKQIAYDYIVAAITSQPAYVP